MESQGKPKAADTAQALARQMADYQPIPWEQLPDLGLYMDQVITFLERHLSSLFLATEAEGRILTPAMINNYVKQRVIPRPNGKKYEREHLAALLMVCALKQVLPIDAVTRLIAAQSGDMRARYETFCAQQSLALARTGAALLREETTALACAVEAGAACLAARALLREGGEQKNGQAP